MNKSASRRACPNRDTINHSSYGKTSPVEVTRPAVPRFIPSNQPHTEIAVDPATQRKPGHRELTNELCVKSGVVYLTEVGMRNLEAGLRRSQTPPQRIQDYFDSYFGVRKQLARCVDLFRRSKRPSTPSGT
jgi:hypothetical protein